MVITLLWYSRDSVSITGFSTIFMLVARKPEEFKPVKSFREALCKLLGLELEDVKLTDEELLELVKFRLADRNTQNT